MQNVSITFVDGNGLAQALVLSPPFQSDIRNYTVTAPFDLSALAAFNLTASFTGSSFYATMPSSAAHADVSAPGLQGPLVPDVPVRLTLASVGVPESVVTLVSPDYGQLYSFHLRLSRPSLSGLCNPGFTDDGHLLLAKQIVLWTFRSGLSPGVVPTTGQTTCFWLRMGSQFQLAPTVPAVTSTILQFGAAQNAVGAQHWIEYDSWGRVVWRFQTNTGTNQPKMYSGESELDARAWSHYCFVASNLTTPQNVLYRNGRKVNSGDFGVWNVTQADALLYLGQKHCALAVASVALAFWSNYLSFLTFSWEFPVLPVVLSVPFRRGWSTARAHR